MTRSEVNPVKWAHQSREFIDEVQVEFKKVSWPTEKETIAGTVSVIVVVIIIGIVLGIVDYGLSQLMGWILP
jgi:preprotein translocase subunit SecE